MWGRGGGWGEWEWGGGDGRGIDKETYKNYNNSYSIYGFFFSAGPNW